MTLKVWNSLTILQPGVLTKSAWHLSHYTFMLYADGGALQIYIFPLSLAFTSQNRMMTNHTKTIFLYGNSVLMTGVEVTLRSNPALNVIYINPAHPGAQEQWKAISDGILIYDRSTTDPRMVQIFSATHPDVPMLGLDANKDVVQVYSNHHHQEHTTQGIADLVRLIKAFDT